MALTNAWEEKHAKVPDPRGFFVSRHDVVCASRRPPLAVIRGTVQDPTGAVLIEVHVRLVDEARNQSWEQTTNEEGFLSSGHWLFGNYRVEVEHPQLQERGD